MPHASRFRLLRRENDLEAGALAGCAECLYAAMMAIDDLLHDRQADASAFVFIAGMKAMKHLENLFGLLGTEPDAVVGINKAVLLSFRGLHRFHTQVDNRLAFRLDELERVTHQVLKHLPQLQGIAFNRWQRIDAQLGTFFPDLELEVVADAVDQRVEVYGLGGQLRMRQARKSQQVVDEADHPR
jgi:hypothetical protein